MKHWHGSTDLVNAFTSDVTGIISSFSTGQDPATVLRTIGNYLVAPTGDGTFAAQDRAVITFGLGIVSTDAFTVGSGSMPDPGLEAEFDWLWWWKTIVSFEGSADAPGQEIAMTDRIAFDSRAMRKMKPRQTLVVLAEYENLNGSPPVVVTGGFRVLFGT